MIRTAPHLLLRADAGRLIGSGHVMRGLALAQAWQAGGGQAVFLSYCESTAWRDRIEASGCRFVPLDAPYPDSSDLRFTLAMLDELGGISGVSAAPWLVLDGYHFEPSYQQAVRATGYRLLVIDDTAHLPHYHADVLLNQNPYADDLDYALDADTTPLLGTRYALVRPEFSAWAEWRRVVPPVARKVLVTMGGSDPDNVTLKVVRALQAIDVEGLEVSVVVGANYSHYGALRTAMRDAPPAFQMVSNVTNMSECMAWADVAVSGGGTTCLELAFMGLPSVVIVLAENQRRGAEYLASAGAIVNLGRNADAPITTITEAVTQLLVKPDIRTALSHSARGLIDGAGASRVVMCLRGDKIRVRRAHLEDCKLLWEWANDPDVRSASFSSDRIPWTDHVEWFRRKLSDPDSMMFIALDNQDSPVGQIRFDTRSDGNVYIGVSVDSRRRRLGYGSSLIDIAVQELFRASSISAVHALIKPDNRSSINAFDQAGFRRQGLEVVADTVALRFVRVKGDEP